MTSALVLFACATLAPLQHAQPVAQQAATPRLDLQVDALVAEALAEPEAVGFSVAIDDERKPRPVPKD